MFRDSTSCEFNCKLSLKGLNPSLSNLANYILCTMCTIQLANRTINWLGDSYGGKQNKQLVRSKQGDKNMLGNDYE